MDRILLPWELICRPSDQGPPGLSPSIVHHLLGLFGHLRLHSGQVLGTESRGIETQEKNYGLQLLGSSNLRTEAKSSMVSHDSLVS